MYAECGLTVNEGKRGITSLLPHFTVTQEVVQSGIPYELTEGSLEGLNIGTASLGGWNKLLGCPVGSDAFCRERAKAIIRKKAAKLKDFNKFQNAQYEYVALSLCGGVADYMVGMLHPDVVQDALRVLDQYARSVFESLYRKEIDELRWALAKAPSGGIGAGIGDPEITAIARHLGSLGGAARVLSRLSDAHRAAGRGAEADSFDAVRKALGAKPGLGGLVTQLRQIVVEVNIPNKILNIPSLSEMQAMPSTASMSVFLHKRQELLILKNGTWTKSQAARLLSRAEKGSG